MTRKLLFLSVAATVFSACNCGGDAATALSFSTQPSTATAGAAIAPAVQVTVVDADGDVVVDPAVVVTLSLQGGTPGAVLTGALSATTVDGVATFPDLAIARAGTGYTLVAAASSLDGATSGAFDVNAGAPGQLAFAVQPTDAEVGGLLAPAPAIRVEDAHGNLVTAAADVSVALGANPGGATLAGTTTAASTSGVATFSELSLDAEGDGYTLVASLGSASATSSAFKVRPSTPVSLAFVTGPSDAVAGVAIAPAVQVEALDARGRRARAATGEVTLTLQGGPSGAALLGTATAAFVDGVATFADLSIEQAGSGYSLRAASGSLTEATSAAFTISAAAAAQLAFTVQPTDAVSGAVLSPAVQLAVTDAFGNVAASSDSVVLSVASGPSGAVLSGTLAKPVVAGLATFDDLSLDLAGGYTLSAALGALAPAGSATFTVGHGAAARLAFTAGPSTTAAGQVITPAVRVTVLDAAGNVATSSSAPVALALAGGAAGATLGGTATIAASNGVATFSDLAITRAGTGYSLQASSPALTSAQSGTFDITAAAPAGLVFAQQPSNVVAGEAISPAVAVAVHDAFGNLVTGATDPIALALAANPAGSILGGTVVRGASGGIATFGDLTVDRVGTGYTVRATSGALTSATSTPFDVQAGPAAKLAFLTQPSNVSAGAAITPAVQVEVLDALGNRVTGSSEAVTLALAGGTTGAALSGTATVAAASGVATFSDLGVDLAGSSYTLAASANALTGATSSAFDVSAGAASRLVFTTQPSHTVAGQAITPAVAVQVRDAFGNLVETSSATVSLTLNGAAGGPWTAAAMAGVATFANVAIDVAGTGYTLTAASGSLTSATSSAFDVTAGAPARLVFSQQPVDGTSGAPFGVAVRIEDALGNLTGSTATVDLTLATGPAGANLSGATSVAASGGVATFAGLGLDKAGSYQLRASAGSMTADSAAFTIAAGAAAQLAFTVQPATTVAGAAISPAVRVALLDAAGNQTASTAGVTLTLGGGSTPATLLGTTSVAAAAGVATFADLAIRTAASGYTLTAASAGLTSVTSATFDITAAPAAALHVLVQPTDTAALAAISPAVQIALRDAFGNPTSSTATVNLALASNPAGGTLSGTTSQAAVDGVATFANLSIDRAGSGYTLSAASAGVASTTTDSFAVVPGVPAQLTFDQQPVDVASLAPFGVTVAIRDAAGNRVASSTAQVNVLLGSNPAGGTLFGVGTVSAASGLATFGGLSIDKAGAYTLRANSPGLTSAFSDTFDVTPGAATRVGFRVHPRNVQAGAAISPAVEVNLLDNGGNVVPSSDVITVALAANPGGSTLSGTTSVAASAGVAAFSDLSLDKVATGYSLRASSGTLLAATSTLFDVTPGAPSRLVFQTQPQSATAGSALAPPVQVAVQDAFGNLVTTATTGITMAVAANPGGGTLSGTTPRAAVGGVASFDDLSIDRPGTGYTLRASSGSLTDAISSAFDIAPGPAAKLAFTVQPSNVVSGATISPAVTVEVQDAGGNRVTGSTASIALTLGNNPGAATLSGATTVTASGGVAVFSDLSLDKAGSGYTLVAASATLTSATSAAFAVSAGSPARLAYTVQPSNVQAGAAITPAVEVSILDAAGNLTASTATVTLALSNNPGGATLSGAVSAAAIAGVARFSNLSLDRSGTGYALAASATGVTGATSASFDVSAGAPAKLAFSVQPSTTTAGDVIAPAVRVAVQDSFGNLVTTATNSIGLALANNPTGALLAGTTVRPAAGGLAVFDDLSIDRSGAGYTLRASSGALTAATSAAFDVVTGAAAKLAFFVQPSNVTAGSAISPAVQVEVQDAAGNRVTSSSAAITVALGNNAGGGTLSGATTVAASSGRATFSNLSIDKSGTGYTLAASSTGLTGATSLGFAVTAAAPAALAYSVQPSNTAAGATITPAVQVQLLDAFGNLTASTADVTVAIASGPGTLSGTTTVAAVNGTASFSTLSIAVAGTYTLGASSGALTGATSASFTVSVGPAAKLAFLVQPTATVSGSVITPAVQVAVQDAAGNVVTTSTATVAMAFGTNPTGAVLGGTLSRAAVAGVATFGDLTVDRSGAGFTLRATSGALTAATSAAFNVTSAGGGGLVYVNPPAGGRIRLVYNAALSTPSTAVLDLVANATLTGYSVGVNLPLDTTRVQANAALLTPGTALPAGTAPVAAKAVIPTTGPLGSVLVSGQSQKASGAGAVTGDTTVGSGAVFYTLRLDLVSGATPGVVFDGAALGPKFRALMRNKVGTDVVNAADFRIGRLEVQ